MTKNWRDKFGEFGKLYYFLQTLFANCKNQSKYPYMLIILDEFAKLCSAKQIYKILWEKCVIGADTLKCALHTFLLANQILLKFTQYIRTNGLAWEQKFNCDYVLL